MLASYKTASFPGGRALSVLLPAGPQGLEQCLAQSGHATDIPLDYHKKSMVPSPLARDKFRAESVRTLPGLDIQMLRESLSLLGLLS